MYYYKLMIWQLTLTVLLLPFVYSEYIPPGPAYRCPANPLAIHPCNCIAEDDRGISVLCENSNLASIGVGMVNLAGFNTTVEKLIISRCNIGRLYGSLLHLVPVRTLLIEYTHIGDIADHTFLGINQTLKELTITNSSLNVFPAAAFQILGNTSIIILNNHKIAALNGSSFSGHMGNVLERLRITNGLLSSITADAFTVLRKLKTLDLQRNDIKELKKSQFKGLRDLEVLDLSHNNLKKVDASQISDLTKLGWFNASHNQLQEITRGAFARNTVLKVLNLSYNNIKKLDANTFRGMRFIRRLFLSDNAISNVGRGTFSSVSRIGTIDLARNNITKIDYQMFFQLNFVELVDVSENQVTEIQKLAFKDLYLVTINVSHNAIKTVEPGSFENCANITFLDMSHNNISVLPVKSFDDTSYATHFYMPFNNLTSLSQIPLQNMTGLKILNVSYNTLTNIPKNSFPKLYELHTLDFSHNRIKHIYNGVFQVLFSLREINLSYNRLKSISSSMLGALPTLLHMDLTYNNLSDISGSAFTRLASIRKLNVAHNRLQKIFQISPSLSDLDLSYNNLSSIPSTVQTWPTMNSLLFLDLSHNKLGDRLGKGSFAGLLTLQKLNLNYNNISTAPWQALSDLNSIQYLEFQGNNITSLAHNAFGRLPIVFGLNLAENGLTDISQRAFDGLLQLLTLNLTANSITYIPNGAFQGLVSLRTLDLSYNRLEKLGNKTHGLFDDCLSLERLNLSHNKISFITRKTFPSDPYIPYKLKEIDLSYNSMPVVTNEILIGTQKVELLNISSNSITEIRQGIIGNLSSLRTLDLSNNQLSTITGILRKPPMNLSAIYLSSNRLYQLPEDDIARMKPVLRFLDVQNNNLREISPLMVSLLENKTNILFNGNNINCDCTLRPAWRWLSRNLHHPSNWDEITCSSPDGVSGEPFVKLSEVSLTCPESDRRSYNETFEVTPDVKFREVAVKSKGLISIRWLVTSNKDIADFYLFLKDGSDEQHSTPLFEKLIAYSDRRYEVTIDEVHNFLKENGKPKMSNSGNYQLCIVAVDSVGTPGDVFKNQCHDIPYSSIKQFLRSSSEKSFASIYTLIISIFLTLSY